MFSPEDLRDRRLSEQILQALQAIRRGEASGLEVVGSSADRDALARSLVRDAIDAFGLDLIVLDMPRGLRVARHGVRIASASEPELIKIAA